MNLFTRQRGQTLVWVAFALLGLLLVIGLAIDFGLVWTERRHMQNAADAGALAGARELCLGNSESAARQKAFEYAVTRNHRPYAQEATITVGSNTVTVVAIERVEVFFGGIFGIPTVTVSADATAACGRVTSACGLWPVAFDIDRWRYLVQASRCNQPFYVWDDDQIVDCETYDCDLNNDGYDDVVVGGDRGWLDLSGVPGLYDHVCLQPGCGESELECWIRSNSGARIELPACISGDSGVKAGAKDGVNARAGDTVAVPLFESVGCTNPSGNCPGGLTYWITAVGCIQVVGWDQNVRLDPIELPTPTPPPPGTVEPTPTKQPRNPIIGKAIVAIMDCSGSCMSNCGGTSGEPGESWEYRAVSLIK
ncbi:MAG: hypothetical protein H5T60_02485 [Anaerolineae bacterium]|nr:hypothetical protein [Anaerolineae bacterium]